MPKYEVYGIIELNVYMGEWEADSREEAMDLANAGCSDVHINGEQAKAIGANEIHGDEGN